MGHLYLIFIIYGVRSSLCLTEGIAEPGYDFPSKRMDDVSSDVKNERSDITEIPEKVENDGNTHNEVIELQQMFRHLKMEINDKLANIEDKIAQNLEDCDLETIASVKTDLEQSKKENSEVKMYLHSISSALSTEKQIFRKMVDAFEKRFEESNQSIRNRTSSFEIRIEGVEKKMITFENASLKGDRGESGPPGPSGPNGTKGSRGDTGTGIKGQKGKQGQTGNTGPKGQKGSAGSPSVKGDKGDVGPAGLPGLTGMKGSQGFKGQKGETGSIGTTGSQGLKGEKGSPETRNSAYFAVSFKREGMSMTSNTILNFDEIFRNTGIGYSEATGKFTAPFSGVYLFLFFVEAYGYQNNFAYLKLYVGGKYVAYAVAETSHNYHDVSGGNAYVTYMSAGQQAWLQTGTHRGSRYYHLYGAGTTFTGVLLY